MSTSGSPKVDLSCWAKRTGTGGGSSTAEWSSAGFNGWRPEKLRFPAIWSMRLAKEGSRRKLGRLSSFGCGGFEIRGAELADSADEHELLRRRPWRAEEEEGEQGEAQREVRHVASSGEGRGRLGDATDGRARGNAPRRPRTASGESERHYCKPCVTGRNREKRGRENDMWGPRVRFDFHLISNFWIVTILPPKRNLVPRFRRKVPN